MAGASSVENSARGIVHVFADREVGEGQVLMRDWLKTLFTRATQLSAADFDDGLAYAISQGWVTEHVSQIRLEEAGHKQVASTAA